MINEKNSTYLLVGNVTKGSATDLSNLPNGAVAVLDAATNQIKTTALSANDRVRIVAKTSKGTLIQSPVFTYSEIVQKDKNEENSFDIQQVSYLGATSDTNVTGIGTVTAGETYVLNIWFRTLIGTTNPLIKFGTYKAITTSQFDLVTGLKESLDRQFSTFANSVIIFDRVGDGTRTAFSAGTGDATGIKVTNGVAGVNYVKAGDAPASVQTALTVGSYIKIKNILYKVKSATTSGFILDQPYTGITETIALTDSTTGTYNSTNFGLKFSGVRQSFDPNIDSVESFLVSFDIQSNDLSVTEYKVIIPQAKASDGARLAYLERYSQFLHKQPVVSSKPNTSYITEVDPNLTYKIYTLTVRNIVPGSVAIGVNYNSTSSIIIAVKGSLSEGIDTIFGIS